MDESNAESTMGQAERDFRELNLNAHFAWSLAFWGSAEKAREAGSTLCAAFAFYYSVLHAGFAWMNALPRIPLADLEQVDHQKILKHLGFYLVGDHANELYRLKQLREATSYLAAPSPVDKMKIVRGHPFYVSDDGKNVSFLETVEEASLSSKLLILRLLESIEHSSTITKLRSPRKGDWEWHEEYLGEDMFLGVFPEHSISDSLRAGFSILKQK